MSAVDSLRTFVPLGPDGASPDGAATAALATPAYWRATAFAIGDWVVGGTRATSPADFHVDELEMHPLGDELLLMMAGAVDVVLEEPAGRRVVELRAGRACIVPRGVWHRLILKEPGELLFVTPPRDTRLRPAAA